MPSSVQTPLSEAVHQAATPEALSFVLEEIGRRYLVARAEEKKFSAAKGEIREACLAALTRLETDRYEWEVDGQAFRALRYPVVKIGPTKALVDLLAGRGLTDCYSARYELNDANVDLAIKRGLVGIEEVRTLSEIRKSEGFSLVAIKSASEEGGDGE